MSLPKYEHFKFGVGDFVRPIAADVGFGEKKPLSSFLQDHDSAVMQVVERIYQECPGGVQLHYKVRTHFAAGGYSRDIDMFNEIELVRHDLPAQGGE